LTAKGEALCWGENDLLQLGVITPRRCKNEFFCPHSDKSIPVFVSGGLTFTTLAVGRFHVCGITSSGSAYCWGGHQFGQLGTSAAVSQCPQPGTNFSERCSAVPQAVEGGLNFIAIAGTDVRTCALTSAGVPYCWGWSVALPELLPGGLTFRSISSGISVSCATTASDLAYCWGSNESGQLGIGSTGAQRTTPVAVTGGVSFTSVGAGGSAACGINTTGKVYCWGDFVELGVSPAPDQCQVGGLFFPCATRPTPIASDLTFKDLTVANHMACALTAEGAVYCWNSDVGLPTLVTGIPPLRWIRAGYLSACGVTADNVAYCWDRTLNVSRAPGQ
jgi:alpha-tubulin suppressor-like RCC1 family protein